MPPPLPPVSFPPPPAAFPFPFPLTPAPLQLQHTARDAKLWKPQASQYQSPYKNGLPPPPFPFPPPLPPPPGAFPAVNSSQIRRPSCSAYPASTPPPPPAAPGPLPPSSPPIVGIELPWWRCSRPAAPASRTSKRSWLLWARSLRCHAGSPRGAVTGNPPRASSKGLHGERRPVV